MTDTKSLREAAAMALDALEYHQEQTRPIARTGAAIEALRAALTLPDADLAWCGCGDVYPADSFEAGIMSATGQCSNCNAGLPDAEPVVWALTETLTKRETTTTGYLWFKNPVNCAWTPLYAAPQPATVERKPLTRHEIHALLDYAGVEANSMKFEHELHVARVIERAHGIQGAA